MTRPALLQQQPIPTDNLIVTLGISGRARNARAATTVQDVMAWPLGKPSTRRFPLPLQKESIARLKAELRHKFQRRDIYDPTTLYRDNESERQFVTLKDTPVTSVVDGIVEATYRYSKKELLAREPEDRSHKWNLCLRARDGTRVYYTHVNSSLKVGDRVVPGQVIGKPHRAFPFIEGVWHFHMDFRDKDGKLFVPYFRPPD